MDLWGLDKRTWRFDGRGEVNGVLGLNPCPIVIYEYDRLRQSQLYKLDGCVRQWDLMQKFMA